MNTKNTNTNTNTNTDPIGDVAKKQNTNTRRSRIWVQILILSCYIMMNQKKQNMDMNRKTNLIVSSYYYCASL